MIPKVCVTQKSVLRGDILKYNCTGLNTIFQNSLHPEHMNMLLFGNKVFADVIKVTRDHTRLE